jgi:Ca-activated chloride channel homolog
MKSVLLIIYIMVGISVNAQVEKRMIRMGNADYKKGKYQEAEKDYRKALGSNPASGNATYNLANSLYKQKQYEAAAREYEQLTGKETDKEKLSRYFYNLGNTLYQNKKYEESIQAYKNALRNNPKDMDAKHNLQMALKMLSKDQKNNNSSDKQDNKQGQQDKKQTDPSQQQNKSQNDSQPRTNQKGQISKEDAERILQAIENEEKEVMKKVQNQKEHTKNVPVEKNW